MLKNLITALTISSCAMACAGDKVVYKADFKNWQPHTKTSSLSTSGGVLKAQTSSSKVVGAKVKLPNIKVTPKTVVSFDWKFQAKKVNYTAFTFSVKGDKTPYYIWFKKNAATGMESNKWHKVTIPATQVKTLRRKNMSQGSIIDGFKVFQAGEAPQNVCIKDFKIVESSKEIKQAQPHKIQIWPRRATVCLPTNLQQFIFVELKNMIPQSKFSITLNLPPAMEIKDFPDAKGWACLPPHRIYPVKWNQNGRIATLEFAPDAKRKLSSWLVLTTDVKTTPGNQELAINVKDGQKLNIQQKFKVKIYPELSGKAPSNLKIISWQYAGLNYKDVPTYVNMQKAAGVNLFCNMHGDAEKGKSISDYIIQQKLGLGIAFFSSKLNYVQEHFGGQFKNIKWDETWLLEHPEILKQVLCKYFEKASGDRKLDSIVYDAESGSFRRGKIHGDVTPYSLEVFRKYAKIPANIKLTPESIKQKYLKQWISFRCHQSNQMATVLRELLDDKFPDTTLGVYSGYEFDEPPFKDRTRKLYSVDWKSMANTGLDYGSAGYGGSMDQLQNTAKALQGKAVYMPAEMYLVNFLTKSSRTSSPEAWGMRLINAYLNSGMKGGLSIWYGNDLDGSALISINMAVELMRKIESYALKGKRDDNAVKVYPDSERNNVYVLRKGGNAMIIATNNEASEKNIRIRLQKFRLKGFTGELQITDIVSGKKIKPQKVLKVNIKPYSYRLLNLLDDGN